METKQKNLHLMSHRDYDDDGKLYLTEKEQYSIMNSTLLKYKLMRFRCKISYEAFLQTKTITELIITQIHKTYEDLMKLNEMK